MGADGYSDGSDDNNRDIDNDNSVEVSFNFNKQNHFFLQQKWAIPYDGFYLYFFRNKGAHGHNGINEVRYSTIIRKRAKPTEGTERQQYCRYVMLD